jgi:hypothetical protein
MAHPGRPAETAPTSKQTAQVSRFVVDKKAMNKLQNPDSDLQLVHKITITMPEAGLVTEIADALWQLDALVRRKGGTLTWMAPHEWMKDGVEVSGHDGIVSERRLPETVEAPVLDELRARMKGVEDQ